MLFNFPDVIYTSSPLMINSVEKVCNQEILPIMNNILAKGVRDEDEKNHTRYYLYMRVEGSSLNFARTMLRFSIYDLEKKGAEEILRSFYIDSIYYKYEEFESNLIRIVVIKKKFENKIHEYYLSKDEEIDRVRYEDKDMKLDEFVKEFKGEEWLKRSKKDGRIGEIVVQKVKSKDENIWLILLVEDKNESGYRVLKHVKVVDIVKDTHLIRRYLGRTCYYKIVENKYKYEYSEIPISLDNMSLYKDELKSYPNVELGVYDFETYKDKKGNLHVYAVGIYTEKHKFHSFYLTDYKDEVDMIKAVLDYMKKTEITQWFAHNGGRFDTILFLNLVLQLKDKNKRMKIDVGDAMLHENKFYQVKIKYGTRYRLKLRDSYLLLPTTLRSLAKDLNLETEKGYFPHQFVDLSTLGYVGPYPNIKYWDRDANNTVKEGIKKKKTFNLKEKSLEYLEKDCIILYTVLKNFHKEFYELFKIDMFKSLTLPSLAVRVWKNTVYYKKIGSIKFNTNIYKAIKSAYFGGFSELYTPVAKDAILYDIRSMYPSFMLKNPMPINDVVWSDNPELEFYNGFCLAKVKTLEWKETGCLPKRVAIQKGDEGLGEYLIAPNGKWTGWYSTIELKNAAKNGYKIEIVEGYHFKTWDNIFTKYVTKLGQIKNESTGARRAISKYLLNSLYGRFGILNRDVISEIKEVSPLSTTSDYKKETDTIFDSNLLQIDDSKIFKSKPKKLYVLKNTHPDTIMNIYPLGDSDNTNFHYVVVEKVIENNNHNYISNFTNVAISASISAYARVSMCSPRNSIDTIYHDTDSLIVFKGPVSESIDNSITPELGSWSYVTGIKKFLSVKPKFYVIIPSDNSPNIFKTAGLPLGHITLQDFEKLITSKDKCEIVKTITRIWPDPIKLTIKEIETKFTISNQYPARVKIFCSDGSYTTTNIEVSDNKVLKSWYEKAGQPYMDHSARELRNILINLKEHPTKCLFQSLNTGVCKIFPSAWSKKPT